MFCVVYVLIFEFVGCVHLVFSCCCLGVFCVTIVLGYLVCCSCLLAGDFGALLVIIVLFGLLVCGVCDLWGVLYAVCLGIGLSGLICLVV